jgi:hypothetical protein
LGLTSKLCARFLRDAGGIEQEEGEGVAVVAVSDNGGCAELRVREKAHVVEALLGLAQTNKYPFIDLTRVDGWPISVKTEHVRRVRADAVAPR